MAEIRRNGFFQKNYSTQYSSADFRDKTAEITDEHAAGGGSAAVVDIDGAIVEAALQSNETLNVFAEDMPRASDAETSSTSLRELRNFHDVTFTKGKKIPYVSLLANSKALASYSPCLPFSDLVESEGQPKTSHFLLWNMNDALAPETIYSSVHPVTIFRLLSATLLVCGLANGQISVYSLALGNLKAITDVNISHRKSVVGLELLTAAVSDRGDGKLLDGGGGGVVQFMSAAGDGQVKIWELSGGGEMEYKLKKVHSVQLMRSENATELSIAGLCHLEQSTFAVATEEGEVAVCDWYVKTAVGDERKPEYIKHISSTTTRSYRPTQSFDYSHLTEALLLVTDWAVHIFRPTVAEPLISTPPPAAYYSCGVFSRSRAGIVYLGRTDGVLEIWDLTDQSNKSLMNFPVGSVALTSIAFDDNGALMAVGDDQGHLHVLQIPGVLQHAQPRETQFIKKLYSIEERRVAHFRERFAVLAEEREERQKTDLLEKQRAQVASESAGKGGFAAGQRQTAGSEGGPSSLDDPEIKKMQTEFDSLKQTFEEAHAVKVTPAPSKTAK